MKGRRTLVLEFERTDAVVGEPVTVRVHDRAQRPVENAVVETRTKAARTDDSGLCQLTFYTPGFWSVRATKAPGERVSYRPATDLVRAVPKPALRRFTRQPNAVTR